MTNLAPTPTPPLARPSVHRRIAVVGAERDHLFHQLTGQGLMLSDRAQPRLDVFAELGVETRAEAVVRARNAGLGG